VLYVCDGLFSRLCTSVGLLIVVEVDLSHTRLFVSSSSNAVPATTQLQAAFYTTALEKVGDIPDQPPDPVRRRPGA
jgi:hypothetical protein